MIKSEYRISHEIKQKNKILARYCLSTILKKLKDNSYKNIITRNREQ